MSITVDITLRLHLDAPTMTPEVEEALRNLADVMGVQAEDGVYRLGSPDAEDGEPNDLVTDIQGWEIVSVEETYSGTDDNQTGDRSTCTRCGLDIEYHPDGWWDRGGDGKCPDNIGGFHSPTEG